MRRSKLILAGWLTGLSACNGDGLPPEYRRLSVPAEQLTSTVAMERGRELLTSEQAWDLTAYVLRASEEGP